MVCAICGKRNPDTARVCMGCGELLSVRAQGNPRQPPDASQPPVSTQKTCGYALSGLILGFLSLVLCGLGVLVAPVGIVLSAYSLNRTSKGDEYAGEGMATAGLIMCCVSFLLQGLVLLLLCVFSLPVFSARGGADVESIVSREMRYQGVGGEKLGQYLADNYPGRRALLLAEPPFRETSARNPDPLVEGLKRGLDGKLPIVAEVRPTIPPDRVKGFAAETTMGMDVG